MAEGRRGGRPDSPRRHGRRRIRVHLSIRLFHSTSTSDPLTMTSLTERGSGTTISLAAAAPARARISIVSCEKGRNGHPRVDRSVGAGKTPSSFQTRVPLLTGPSPAPASHDVEFETQRASDVGHGEEARVGGFSSLDLPNGGVRDAASSSEFLLGQTSATPRPSDGLTEALPTPSVLGRDGFPSSRHCE